METPAVSITKAHITKNLYDNCGFSKDKSEAALETLLELIKSTLASGEDIMVTGFGKFHVHTKSKRRGRNPKTGEVLMLVPRKVVSFKCSGKLRERING